MALSASAIDAESVGPIVRRLSMRSNYYDEEINPFQSWFRLSGYETGPGEESEGSDSLQVSNLLNEPQTDLPDERLLQWIWSRQNIIRSGIRTRQGISLEILHPGFWNQHAGPDFSRAMIRFGSSPPVTGDVEIEVSSPNWAGHGHDRNFHFAHVILLVVWEIPAAWSEARCSLPVLELRSLLVSTLDDQRFWMGTASPTQSVSSFETGRCRGSFMKLSDGDADGILSAAGLSRIRQRSRTFSAWTSQYGGSQSLILGLFTALGMPGNSWPMRYLVEKLLTEGYTSSSGGWMHAQAVILGVAGWLPASLEADCPTAQSFLRELWDIWWREQNVWESHILPRELWNLRKCRPLNHPQRRLALAAYWLGNPDLDNQLVDWAQKASSSAPPSALRSLRKLLDPPESQFWENYFSVSHPEMIPRPTGLLGRHQLIDLAVNGLFPWLMANPVLGHPDGGREWRRNIEKLLCQFPASQENHRTRHLRTRLFGGRDSGPKGKAIFQQGLLQIEVEFCQVSNSLCSRCDMPARLAGLTSCQKDYPTDPPD